MPRKTFIYEGRRYDVRARTQEELYEKIAQKKLDLKERRIKADNISVQDYYQEWYRTFKEPYIKENTQMMYRTASHCVIRYIGKMKMHVVTAGDIQRMITAEYSAGKSKSHIDKLFVVLRQIFSQAYIDKRIPENPMLSIKPPKMQENPGRAVTEEERSAILHVAKTHRYGRWIRVMLYLGLRPIETAGIQGRDIDLDSNIIHIRGTKSKKADRYIPIPEIIRDDLAGFRDNEYIFTTKAGNPPDRDRRDDWWNAFKRDLDLYMGAETFRNKIVKSVVAEDLTAYCLRHTFGTDAQAAGVPIDVLADLMGHEKIETTRRYYIHDNIASKRRAAELLESYRNAKK